jgi:hypothetical protein
LASTANSITTNSFDSLYATLGIQQSSFAYIGSYTDISGVHTLIQSGFNFASNNIVNFTSNNNTINASFVSCNSGGFICVPVVGNLAISNVSTLQNHVLGAPYSGNLTIYINPAGYYEYIITNGTTEVPASLYINTPPGQLDNQVNYSFFGMHYVGNLFNISSNVITNSTYKGSIFYSQLIDISPLEYDMLGGNLTPSSYTDYIYNNELSFYNTTLVFNLSATSGCSLKPTGFFGGIENWLTGAKCALTQFALNINFQLINLITGGHNTQVNLNNAESSVSPSVAIPIVLNNIQNASRAYPLYVSYAYPGICLGDTAGQALKDWGTCLYSEQTGMMNFNNYVDGIYAPSIQMSEFLGTDVPLILGFALIMLIIKKINGE